MIGPENMEIRRNETSPVHWFWTIKRVQIALVFVFAFGVKIGAAHCDKETVVFVQNEIVVGEQMTGVSTFWNAPLEQSGGSLLWYKIENFFLLEKVHVSK